MACLYGGTSPLITGPGVEELLLSDRCRVPGEQRSAQFALRHGASNYIGKRTQALVAR